MVGEAGDVQAFLAGHPPFDRLTEDQQVFAAGHTYVAFSKSGDSIQLDVTNEQLDGVGLLMVRSGSLEIRDLQGELLDRLSSGDYLLPQVLQAERGDVSVVVLEDCLYYELELGAFQTLVNADAELATICKLHQRADTVQSETETDIDKTAIDEYVRDVMTSGIITAESAMTIRDAAALMKQHHISSLLVKSSIATDSPLAGIVTDRDFRIRVLAEGVPDDEPIAKIMTPSPMTIDVNSKLNDAQLMMMAEGIRHLPVLEDNRIVGMISQTDILHANNIEPMSLIHAINRSASIEELSEVAEKIPALIVKLVARDTRANEIGKILTTLTDAVTRRLIKLAESRYGPPPCEYAWLAFGSQARQEQALGSDQDNALLLSDAVLDVDQDYFRRFAEFINDGLNFCGIPYCPGDIMAKNDKWRLPLQGWKDCFRKWIDEPSPKAVMHSSIFFDMRQIAGSTALTAALHDDVLKRAAKNTIFQAMMCDNALSHSPPLGFFKTFVLEHDGDHNHMLDLKKRGTIPIVDIARNYALAEGIDVTNTIERLRALSGCGAMSASMSSSLVDAHEFIAGIRLESQGRQFTADVEVDNFLDPAVLSPLVRHQLKDAFSIVREAQTAMKARFGGGVL